MNDDAVFVPLWPFQRQHAPSGVEMVAQVLAPLRVEGESSSSRC